MSQYPSSPEEIKSFSRSPTFKPRIEDKLIQGRQATLRKIEEMRLKQQEEIKQLSPGKPLISKKTEQLAVKAEERFFRRHSPAKVPPPPQKQPQSPSQVGFQRASSSLRSTGSQTSPSRSTSMLRGPLTANSLYNLTSLERNQQWLDRKSLHIAKQRESLAQAGLKECTFAPKLTSSPGKSPFASPDKFDLCLYRAEKKERSTDVYKSLSPFKVSLGQFRPETFLERREQAKQSALMSKTIW